jgi:Carbohydrate binding module (family 6)/Abnormal spindle-like microcephaly-assoc'd, ASPM-SPD-2-Hydin
VTSALQVNSATIIGAGSWYSQIKTNEFIDNTSAVAGPVNLSGFAILGSTVGRHDDSTANAINGSLGSGFTVNGLWIQDTNVGFWLQFGNSNCTVENNVIESTDADGLNFNGNATSCTGNSVTGLASAGTAYASDSSGFTAMLSGNSWQNGAAEGPYGGTASAVPGTVQAVSYDTGGQGAGYNVTSVNGTGNGYRSDGVDIEACTDTGCGDDLGWTAPGQWFRYTVNVAAAGAYTVSFRVAAPSAVTDAFHLTDARGDDLSDAETLPATGGWQGWTTVTDTIPLPAGRQTLIVDQDNPGWNLRYLSFAAGGSGGGSALSASPSSASFGSVTVGSASAAQTVTVSNPNSSAVSVSSASVSGPFSQASTCGTSIAANGSCTVSVTFAPTAAGPATGSLAVASSAPGSPLTVALSGTGTSANTNLALGQPTSASGYTQAYVPANAVDGNASSYWESTDNVWV